ncbi:BF3164 family lipoprotein [Proteiniphilum sp. X52]|uniref:BF3164 family lipoprotein n=1 Tax=Proteiniphilum sp. X52 TaxID=2382159 RepID=UPI001314B684|nr:BF3164 family lipoprotein [Proteiniphilum sp. X52]
MKNYIVCSLVIFVFFSCENNTDSLTGLFNNTKRLNHNELTYESDYLMGSSGKMLISDSVLITLDYNNERMFHVFDIKNNKYINNLGVKGQGLNEFLHPYSLIHHSHIDFLSYDLLDNSLKKIRIDSLMKGAIFYEKMISFNSISNSMVIPTKHNHYVGFGLYESNMFKLIDADGEDIGLFMDFPTDKETKKIDHRNVALGYQGSLAINPDGDKLVYASLYGTILGIYNIKEKSVSQEFLLVYDYPQFTVQNEGGSMSSPITKDGISAFTDIYVTDKYIYALYSGKTISKLGAKAFEAQYIYVFNWKGTPLICYHLDIPVNNIAIDPDNKKIYAISNLPEPTLVEFEIDL